MNIEFLLLIISIQVAFLTAIVIGAIVWRYRRDKKRDSSMAENLRITLQRKYEMEQLRLKNKNGSNLAC